jgi:hypothetical protein
VCKGLLKTTTSDRQAHSSVSFLVVFITPFLYGMERAVIGTFDVFRPDIDLHFVQSNRIFEREPPVIQEMLRRCFSMTLLPGKEDWEPLGRPRSLRHHLEMKLRQQRTELHNPAVASVTERR